MVNTRQKLREYLKQIKKNDQKGNKINAFLQLNPNVLKDAKRIDSKKNKGKLAGKIIGVKAAINVKGLNASCASKTLENYKSPYDATVIKKIKDEDGLIIGMTNCDEFCSGSSGETSAYKPTKNPKNLKLIPGGSSSGSAACVSANFCDMALGSDTGGSIRNPASHCGVVGIKPTYGSVSRYGLIDLSMSLDQIGPITKNVNESALLLSIISGRDENDSITQESLKLNLKEIEKIPKNITIGILDFKIQDQKIQELIDDKIKEAADKYKWKIKKIKIDHIDLAIETYYLLVYVEFFSATRRFDGRRYGKRIEEVAGPEVLRRILGGSEITKAEYLGRYYHLALKAKKLIEKEFERAFKNVDCIITPTVPRLPHKIGEKISLKDMYSYDALTIPSNLAGNCAISIPSGKINEVPVGMQIICDKFQEQKMLQIARSIEKI
ncbi:Asp-tRNA(Asn)/Glu-tRNA(Gln) amidotransferase GatCAB subunit A [Candidatus Pacearchaeota archaeon]|jgi:aspartyl-tRNA(Asn)/glutamyl-tRNA(Gln) amidotransferase subunit A|nr:Asp-tRNA(Asn)/Glu-tRNA(Gln) amidotransferase GatCAB subunit A [Candidatus Pacearchaeota archaeon]